MKAGLIVAAVLAATAPASGTNQCGDDSVVRLDMTSDGAGSQSPATLCQYLTELNTIFNDVPEFTDRSKDTAGGTGKVFSTRITNNEEESTSFVFESNFAGLRQGQVDFVRALYGLGEGHPPAEFSRFLDPTFVPGAATTIESNLISKVGGSDVDKVALSYTEFTFIDPSLFSDLLPGLASSSEAVLKVLEGILSLLNRELVFVSGQKTLEGSDAGTSDYADGTCTVLGNPSVRDAWVWKDDWLAKIYHYPQATLGDDGAYARLWRELAKFPQKCRARNVYPSGDRLCIQADGTAADGTTTFKVRVSHLITSDISCIAGALNQVPEIRTLLDEQQANAYNAEAQLLECEIARLAVPQADTYPIVGGVDCAALIETQRLRAQTPEGRTQKISQVVTGPGAAEAQPAVSPELSGPPSSSSCASWPVLVGAVWTAAALALVVLVLASAQYSRRVPPKTPAAEPSAVDC